MFRSMTCHFLDTRLLKIGNTPNDPRMALSTNCRKSLYTLNTYPQGPKLTLFRSTTSRFRDTMLSKIGNAQNDLKHLTVKSILYTMNTHLKVQISLRFALREAVFEI